MENISHLFFDYLITLGLSESLAKYLNMFALLLISIIVIYTIDYVIKKILISSFGQFARKSKTNFDDILIQNRAIRKLAHIIPLYLTIEIIPIVFTDFDFIENILNKAIRIIFILLILRVVKSLFNSIRDYLKTLNRFKDKPIDSYIQVLMIFIWVGGILSIFAIVTNISIWKFFTAMGAASAVLILVFKDTILGFVASIQVTINDMVRINDWITFDKYGADGNVIEINLATVKVQNFDKTITTIPTYALISDSFKNWRGMEKSGGRRIKRALIIELNSIKYLSENEVDKLKNIQLITSYLEVSQKNIKKFNDQNNINKDLLINGRNLTNIGVFRKYVETFIENHSAINKEMMVMTRQLEPTTQGIPIEIYAFSSDKRWQNYEYIMAEIFDHLIASVPYFNLEIFELPNNLSFKNQSSSEIKL
ncbi:MAG: mechanosensitive ion channel domain-containing protein [Bacteroidota bacterium]